MGRVRGHSACGVAKGQQTTFMNDGDYGQFKLDMGFTVFTHLVDRRASLPTPYPPLFLSHAVS